jgi:hypothetical protein
MPIFGLVEVDLKHPVAATDSFFGCSGGVFRMVLVYDSPAVADDLDGFICVSAGNGKRC